MKIRSARIVNFQSFEDSGVLDFADGINLIVGQNNSGKSAILRALLPALSNDPHRTPARWQDHLVARPQVSLSIDLSGAELRDQILRTLGPGNAIFIPTPDRPSAPHFIEELLERPGIHVNVTRSHNESFRSAYPGHAMFNYAVGASQYAARISALDGQLIVTGTEKSDDSTADMVYALWQRSMFHFSAERLGIGRSMQAHVDRLAPDASNLPAVLDTISGGRGDIFQRLVGHLRDVFSTVGNLSVWPVPGAPGHIEIRVWPTPSMEQVQLSFPLSASGTGVSQVIAILTAIMTVDDAVIMIDEINSFLHPAAVKALLRILQSEYSQHQYIISTHSPDVISFSNPRTIHLVKRDGYESSAQMLALEEVEALREVGEHLGVSMSDVFAAERIIWVEGPTEELCFPYLYQRDANRPLPRGTVITSVARTGDFVAKRRNVELVWAVYERLSKAATPLVVSVKFSFDSEDLSEGDKQDVLRRARGQVFFLPRRLLECYVVVPAAIADFVNGKDTFEGGRVSEGDVRAALVDAAEGRFRIAEWTGDLSDETWLSKVDAARLIGAVVSQVSEQRVTFNKKDDTLLLLRTVYETEPEKLASLVSYVRELVDQQP